MAAALVIGTGAGIMRARWAASPPLPAWDGPEAGSATRETELRLSQAVRRAPADPQAYRALARFYLDDSKPFEALWVLQDAQRLDPRALEPRLLMAGALEMGQLYQPAAAVLQAAVAAHPEDTEAPWQLAHLQLSLGRPAAAVATLQSLAKRQPLPDGAVLLLGRALEGSGQDAQALAQYQRYRQLAPQSEQGPLRAARLLLRMGRTAEAQQAVAAARALNPHRAEALYLLGMIEQRRGPSHEAAARRDFMEAARAQEPFAPAFVQLAAYSQRHRDWKRASELLAQATRLDPQNAEALRQLASVRRKLGDLAGARYYEGRYYEAKDARPKATAQYEALAAARDDPQGPLLVSSGYVKMDQKQKAAQVARDGLLRHPGDLELTERLIASDLITGSAKEAEQLCRDWMRRDPKALQPVWLLGRVRLLYHDREGALKLFERAARAEPKNAEYQFAIGSAYADRPSPADWKLAARCYGQAALLKPDEARYRQNLAIALQSIGDLEGARRQFLRSMDLDANQSAPLNNLVQVARGLKQFDQVEFWAPLVREVEQRLREELPGWKRVWDDPRDVEGYVLLARFLERTGELRQARNVLEQAVALRPDLAPARRELATLQRTLDVL